MTVIHLMGHLMERQLDPAAGYLLQKDLERRGIAVHCKGATKAILGTDRAEAERLARSRGIVDYVASLTDSQAFALSEAISGRADRLWALGQRL